MMLCKTLTAATFVLASSVAMAIPSADQSLANRADARVHQITNVDRYLGEVEQTVDLARAGEYGKIKNIDLSKLDQAQETIEGLLEGRDNARELKAEQRIELFNAQELITSIVRNDQKDRRICKRVKATGTRLAKAECMTVAERETRARTARLNAREIQSAAGRTEPPEERIGTNLGGGR